MMKTKFLTLSLGALLVPSAFALPTLYPLEDTMDILYDIENPTDSDIIADSENPYRIYVRPPNDGKAEVMGLHTINANVGNCKFMGELQEDAKDTVRRERKIRDLLEKNIEDYDKLQEKISQIQEEYERLIENENLGDLENIDNRLEIVESRIAEILEKLEDCSESCDDLRDERNTLQKERKDLTDERRKIVRANSVATRKYEQISKRLKTQKEINKEKNDYIEDLQSSLKRMRSSYLSLYKDFGQMEGGMAALKFTSSWQKNVDKLRDLNPGISFEKIETRDAKISTSIVGLKSIPGDTAIIEYIMPGASNDGRHMELSAYPETLSGNIRLSLLGACPMLHPEYFDLEHDIGVDKMKYGIIASYEYPTWAGIDATVEYNMYSMYQKIVSNYSSGGGFWKRRRASTNVEERSLFEDSFTVVWKDTVELPQEEKDNREQEMRHRLIARMVGDITAMVSSSGELTLPTPPASGAAVLSQGLSGACSNSKICKAAILGIDFLDAFFGSASAQTSFTSVKNVNMSENWSSHQVLWRPWVTSYNQSK